MAERPIRITRGLRFGPPELRVTFTLEQAAQADALHAQALDAGLAPQRGRRGYASRPGENVTEEFVAFAITTTSATTSVNSRATTVDVQAIATVLQTFFERNKGLAVRFGKNDVIQAPEQLSNKEILDLLAPLTRR